MMESLKRKTILVVDFEERNLKTINDILDPYYFVILANNADDAVNLALTKNPDIILLDICMPQVTVAGKLMEDEIQKHCPIIYLTSVDRHEFIQEAYDLGGVDYITKPVKPKELLQKVDTHMAVHEKQKRIESLVSELEECKHELSFLLSHELKSKVSGAYELIRILRTDLPSLAESEVVKILQLCEGNLENTRKIVTKLQAWSKSKSEFGTPLDIKAYQALGAA